MITGGSITKIPYKHKTIRVWAIVHRKETEVMVNAIEDQIDSQATEKLERRELPKVRFWAPHSHPSFPPFPDGFRNILGSINILPHLSTCSRKSKSQYTTLFQNKNVCFMYSFDKGQKCPKLITI